MGIEPIPSVITILTRFALGLTSIQPPKRLALFHRAIDTVQDDGFELYRR
jgi:hypothetical protein